MPTTEVAADALTDGAINIMDLLVLCGLTASKSEARRVITQGGLSVDGEKVTAIDFAVTEAMLSEGIKIKKGKKVFHKAVMQ